MAKKKKNPELVHCKLTKTANQRAPWRLWYTVERDGKPRRVFQSFATEADAWDEAQKKELDIANHGIRFGELPPEARRAFDFYRDTAAELAEAGATVPRFEELVADALAAVRAAFNAREENAITVAEGVALFVDYKRSRVKQRQLADLKDRLKRFAETFGTRPVRSITTAEIETWLAGLRSRHNPGKLAVPPLLGPLSRNHYRANLHAFFTYGTAAGRGWTERNPVADLEKEQYTTRKPNPYTSEDAGKIMRTALESMPHLVPMMALGLFAGLRTSEALVADLSTLSMKDDEFRVEDDRKTGARMAPFNAACKAWIAAQPRRKGKAWLESDRSFYDERQKLLALAKVDLIPNGARDSYISYRCAETRDIARVADECGNSVATIRKHYRKIVTTEAAAAFFAIRPEAPAANVTHIQQGRASA